MASDEYRAVLFDLLSALLDSWSLWSKVARSGKAALAWRNRSLELTQAAGPYRNYQEILREAALDVGEPRERADELILRWGELAPWPETPDVVRTLAEKIPVGVVTNCSAALARVAVARIGIPFAIVVTAEEAGYYKPHPRPYRMALERIGCEPGNALYVAGSLADGSGASAAGMPVYWHNRRRLPSSDPTTQPRYVSASLLPLLEIV